MDKKDLWPLGGIGFILIVTAAWWGLALWSVPGAPEWLERTRSVCFNITESGLPDAKGWLLLIGQPPATLATLLVGWSSEVKGALGRLLAAPGGRALAVMTLALAVTGTVAAGLRVRSASRPVFSAFADEPAPETYPRLDRSWPELTGVVDQRGAPFDLASLQGRGALVTFAFGHCRTVCPAVVHQVRSTRLEASPELAIVVVSLDPWRDTPGRLPALLEQYQLDPDRDFVLSGPVEAVEAALDAWRIPRERDSTSGDIIHPSLVYLVEPDGTIAYGSTGGVTQMISLARRLRPAASKE